MKYFLLSLVIAPAALTAASFEGKVSFKMTSGKSQPQEIVYNIKGDKIRMEMPGQKGGMGGMIMDMGKREMIMIMNEQRMYMTMAMPDAAIEAAKKKEGEVKLEKTNETENILGYTATKYIVTSDKTTTDLWLAEGLGTFMSFNQGGNPMMGGRGRSGPPPQGWERALAGKDLFPLRVVGKDFRMETTAIEKKTLPDSMFSPPDGYQKFDMGSMMRGMIPGRN